jgi:Ni/Co efflux regulator RcnB
MSMKQFITVLVAALFAAASVTAIAQDKKADTGMEKSKATKSDKAKKAAPKKTAKKAPKKDDKKDEMKK